MLCLKEKSEFQKKGNCGIRINMTIKQMLIKAYIPKDKKNYRTGLYFVEVNSQDDLLAKYCTRNREVQQSNMNVI